MRFTTHPLADQRVAKAFAKSTLDHPLARRLASSLAVMTTAGDQLAVEFYGMLFTRYPGVRALFPVDMASQRKKLLETLEWVVNHLDQPQEVLPAVADLGRRHKDYGAVAEHYPIVTDLLIEAMAKVSGKAWTSEIQSDWRTAIEMLSRRMIEASR
jgi:hemoglobin-like flavoprotein